MAESACFLLPRKMPLELVLPLLRLKTYKMNCAEAPLQELDPQRCYQTQ